MKRDSITTNMPKNIMQYLIGFSLYLLFYGSFNPLKLILGLASFIITYSAIYPYNDLMDYESDKKDKFKKVYKALVRGDISQKGAISLVFGLPVIGLLIASTLGGWYMFLLIILLFQNFLHSSPYTTKIFKKKKRYMVPNMFIMQFIKFSLGWFTFTTDVIGLPIWILNAFGFGYVFAYMLYKTDIKNMLGAMKKKLKIMIPLGTLTVVSYVISFMIYPFKIPLLLVIPLVLLIFTMSKQKDVIKKTFKLANITLVILTGIMIMLLLLNVPVIESANDNTTEFFNKINNITLQKMNNNTYQLILKINETLYTYPIHDLNELNNIFNITGKEITVRNDTIV